MTDFACKLIHLLESKNVAKVSTEAIERSSIWVDESALRLIKPQAYEKTQQQLDACRHRAVYEKMAKLWLLPFIFSSKKVEDSNILSVRKRKMSKLFCSVNATGFIPSSINSSSPRVSLCSVARA